MSKHRLKARSKVGLVAAASLVAMTMAPMSAVFAASGPATSRLGGVDRMATAIQIAQQEYPNGPSSGTVIIASGDNANLIDSVTVAPLAKALGAPILLSQSATQLSSETASYLTSNNITKVILVGAAANPTLAAQLPAGVSVQNISGADRFATAAAIAQALEKAENVSSFSTVYVASGEDQNMSDPLAIAPFAAKQGAPILLAASGSTTLPSSEASLITGSSSQTEVVVGAAVGYGLSAGGDTQQTIGSGSNSNYANAVAIAQHFAPSNGYSIIDVANDSSTDVVQANGTVSYHLVDAITGGPLAAMQGAPIIFTDGSTVTSSVQSFLSSSAAKNATTVNVFGGTASIPDSTVGQVVNALTGTTPPPTSAVPTVSNITVTGQTFGTGAATSPAVTTNGSPLTVSATLTNAQGNPIPGVDLTLDIGIGNQSTPTVTSGGTVLTPTSGTFFGESGDSYAVPTDQNGVASATISVPSGVGATYTIQYAGPYSVNGTTITDAKAYLEFVTSTTMGISPVGTYGSPFNAAVSSISNETTGLVPVTVTLPPVNGVQPQNVSVSFMLAVPTSESGPFLANSSGGAVTASPGTTPITIGNTQYNTYTTTVNTDSNGQAVVYVDSNSTTSAPVEVQATATDSSGTLIASTWVSWGQSGVPQKLKPNSLTAAGVTNNLGNIGIGNTGNGFSTSIPFYTANIGNQVTVTGLVQDAVGNPVVNAPLIVVASSTQQVNNTNSYIQNGTKTLFPAVGTYNPNITFNNPQVGQGGNTAISGSPNASSSYGEMITTDSAGYFSFTVENTLATGTVTQDQTSDSINQYEVYGIQNGEISLPIQGATVQIDWQNGQQLTEIAVGPTNSLNYHNKSMGATQIPAAAAPPITVPGPTFYFEGLAGSQSYAANGQSATYNISVNNTGNVAAVFFYGPGGTEYGYLINPTVNPSATNSLPSGITWLNAQSPANETIANGAGAVSVAVTPTGTAGQYNITINGVAVTNPNGPATYASSDVIGLGIQDQNSNSDTVTIQSGNITNTVTVNVQAGTPFKMGNDNPASLYLQPGATGTVTLTVEDNNGNPVANTVVPVDVYDLTHSTTASVYLQDLWLTAVNGVTLQQNEPVTSATNSNVAQEPTPIPLFNLTGSGETPLYSSVNVTGVASANNIGTSSETINLTTNGSGQIQLSFTAGNVSYFNNQYQVVASNLATSGQTLDVSYKSSPYTIELVLSQSASPSGLLGHVKGSIDF